MNSLFRRSSQLLIAGLLVAATPAVPAMAQSATDYPNKPVMMVLPFGPGGSTDPLARLVAQHMAEELGHPVVVDNRPGGNTVIATDAVAKSPNDGYTLLYTATTHVVNDVLMSDLTYDAFDDFQPVASIARSDLVLVVHPSVQAETVEEFIELAKADPGAINYATSGIGNPNHLAGEYFSILTGAQLNNVAYQGAGPAIVDLLGGHVQAMFAVPISVTEHIKAGTLRALATTGSQPVEGISVPTFADVGYPDLELSIWNGIFAPADTPREIVDRLSEVVATTLEKSEVIEALAVQGQVPWYTNPNDFGQSLAMERDMYASIIEKANIVLE